MAREAAGAWVRSWGCLAALLFVLLSVAQAAADEPLGPPFGISKYAAKIDEFGVEQDEDVYAAPLAVGEKLTVSVVAKKGSALRPELTLVTPEGAVLEEVGLGVKHDRTGRKATLRNFTPPGTGQWGIRVRGLDDTTGDYTITMRVTKARPIRLRNQMLDAAGQASMDHRFGSFDGAELSVTVTWKRGQSPVRIDAILDPQGNEVQNPLGGLAKEAVVSRGATKLLLKKMPLSEGAGEYTVRTAIDEGTATYTILISVNPRSRINTGRKPVVLGSGEPRLNASGGPLLGFGGFRSTASGSGFATGARVFVGGREATDVTVDPLGGSLSFKAPDGPEGETVSLAVQNPDGQATRREAYFLYPPAPVITDVTDVAGAPIRGGSTGGSQSRRIVGENFTHLPPNNKVTVRFGTAGAAVQSVSGDRKVILVETGFSPAGSYKVVVTDAFGRTATSSFDYVAKTPPAFQATPFSPAFGASAGGTPMTVRTSGLQADDKLLIDGVEIATTYVSASAATFSSPAKPPKTYDAYLVDRYGSSSPRADFVVQGPPTINSVAGVSGPFAGPNEIPLAGGTVLRIDGANFSAGNTFSLGGNQFTPTTVNANAVDFVAPSSMTFGAVSLTVTDAIGQSSTLDDAVRYVGFVDSTEKRTPEPSGADNYTAHRGALGDLDGDTLGDDLVLGSYDAYYYPPGTRPTLTRVLFGDGTTLNDATDSNFPKAFSDPNGIDPWRADAVGIGDIDGSAGADVVTGGFVGYGYTYYGYTYSYYYNDVRVFSNDGNGSFTFNTKASPGALGQYVVVHDTTTGGTYPLFRTTRPYLGFGLTNALAIGDIDGDKDNDVVLGTSRYRAGFLLMSTYNVSFSPGYYSSPYAHYYSYYGYGYGYYYYAPGTVVFANEISSTGTLRDVSFPRLPLPFSFSPALASADIALGDVDRDGDLDLIGTWPDPPSTTPYGQYTSGSYYTYYTSYDYPRLSSFVMTNDGKGFFTDASSSWFPATAGDEFWQGHRLAVVDLDNDSDLDVVLLLGQSVDAYKGTPTYAKHALRILRNDGSKFTDVTTSALPKVPLTGTKDDNLRGYALRVKDVNKDGYPDILVGTAEPLVDSNGKPVRRTRLLFGRAGLTFGLGNEFLPPVTTDSGEAGDLLVGDVGGDTENELVLITEFYPQYSYGYRYLRTFDWKR